MSQEKEKYEKEFKYLERLRQSGVTNMYGAGPYLREEFNISKEESYEILKQWIKRYAELSKKYGWER
jgi:tRNA uridine 5-carbamoylmethylation protein Kti12